MGQSCGVERAGGAQPGDAGGAPPTATSRLAAPLEPGSSPALPALGRRTADAGCLQVEEGFDAQVPPQQEQLPRFRLDRFAVERWELGECLVPGRFGSGWRRWYTQGPEIGRGVSAQVYEARASGGDPLGCDALGLAAGAVCDEGHVQCARTACSITGAAEAPWPEPRPRGRRVAVKQFKMYGKDSYSLELVALASVGVHPNVVRLLENYRDPRCGGEDVLVYEFCDGPSLWGLHRDFKRKRKPVPALLAARLVRQMFKALEHLERCGVEHQDVKPDNMLLFDLCLESETAHLKLGDFGWSTVGPWRASRALPQGGIGTLWYAAPELNPPLAPQAPAAEALVGAAKPAPPDNTRSTTVGDSLPEDAELSCTEAARAAGGVAGLAEELEGPAGAPTLSSGEPGPVAAPAGGVGLGPGAAVGGEAAGDVAGLAGAVAGLVGTAAGAEPGLSASEAPAGCSRARFAALRLVHGRAAHNESRREGVGGGAGVLVEPRCHFYELTDTSPSMPDITASIHARLTQYSISSRPTRQFDEDCERLPDLADGPKDSDEHGNANVPGAPMESERGAGGFFLNDEGDIKLKEDAMPMRDWHRRRANSYRRRITVQAVLGLLVHGDMTKHFAP
ncbi:unnamed protein product [Prorocentrum cordatum]|uniref:Protein kinase domain-containing protein n=1 Tax=Prorocentrum cordatum TaxID=2364126 RepID=A0ABN9UY68_9DINO|nr:unnamed protein product [Polarella glacialis]